MPPCVHLQKLYQLCEDNQLKLSSSDLIHVVCLQCQRQDVCPSTLTDEYDQREEGHEEGHEEESSESPDGDS